MTLPPRTDRPSPPSSSTAQADEETREFASFMAGQSPVDAQAATWLVRRQDGLSPQEETEFQNWLAIDPAHRAAMEQLDGTWSRIGTLPREEVEKLQVPPPQGLAERPSAPRAPARPRAAWWPFAPAPLVPRFAAAALAICVAGGAWIGWDQWQRQPVFSQNFATARGQQLDVQLPDGSRLRLDTATRAEVTLYRQRREVRLPEGQAMFTVQANASQPFDVLAGPVRVTVVGTRFSVRNTPTGLGEAGVSVVVEEGRVRVASVEGSPGAGDSQVLSAGQSLQADREGHLGTAVDEPARGAMVWREGRVNFERTPLRQALAEFERYGSTRLVVRDPAVAEMRINGSFDLRQWSVFAKALPQVLPVRVQVRDGVSEVVATP